jgi:DNA-binding NtrC family response regulator
MAIRSLRFDPAGRPFGPVRHELSIASAGDILKLKSSHPRAAFVVSRNDLQLFLAFAEAVVDCREKADSKELARLMLDEQKGKKKKKKEQKEPRVPVISAGFTSVGRVKQGVRALLEQARSQGEENIYVIGIRDELFQEIWDLCEPAAPLSRRRGRGKGNMLDPDHLESSLLEETEPLPIPAALSAKYVGESESVRSVLQRIVRAAATDSPVLVLGETGTGKGIAASLIHYNSVRKELPFITVNCSAIPTELFELEFFGCVENLTHKAPARIGHCEQAGAGTLFLDEVADLSLFHQGKLLRVLEEKEFWRIGSRHPRKFRARVIAATNRDLFEMTRSGAFRDDLYYRLRGMMIFTPALRSHREDIPALANRFWESATGGKVPPLSAKVLAELQTYPWSGNVRDLRLFLNAAYSSFGRKPLDVRRIRMLWLSEEHMRSARLSRAAAGKPANPPWVDCLQHLRQVTEIMQAVRETFKPLDGAGPLAAAEAQATRGAALNRLNEIDALCQSHKRFDIEAVQGVAGVLDDVNGALRLLCVYLEKDRPRAAAQKKTVERKIKRALSVVNRGVESLFSRV